jgi:predicted XRE-type DNA-binding protein
MLKTDLDSSVLNALGAGLSVTEIQHKFGFASRNPVYRIRDNAAKIAAANLYGAELIEQIHRRLNRRGAPHQIAQALGITQQEVSDIIQAVPAFQTIHYQHAMIDRLGNELYEAIADDIRENANPILLMNCYGVDSHILRNVKRSIFPQSESPKSMRKRILRHAKIKAAVEVANRSIMQRWECDESTADKIRRVLWSTQQGATHG